MHKNCNRCKAIPDFYKIGSTENIISCKLGYNCIVVKKINIGGYKIFHSIPVGLCTKVLTLKEFISAKQSGIKNGITKKPIIIKAKENKKVKKNKNILPMYVGTGCPRHGKKYLKKEGQIIFCNADTPNEITNKCFYHINKIKRKNISKVITYE
jgi:hypothetical protein